MRASCQAKRALLAVPVLLSIAEAVGEEVEMVVVMPKVVMEEPVGVVEPVMEMEDMRVADVVMVEAGAEVET